MTDRIDQARAALRRIWGYDAFRGAQEAVIAATLGGEDVLVLMPTGGGKSLCYQVPALLREGVTVVVSPLIALMQDQVAALQQLGVRAAYWNSSQDAAAQAAVIDRLRRAELDLVYIAPERLLLPTTLDLLERTAVAAFAIDEAHCVSQWGHDFRQDYLELGGLRAHFPDVPMMALTATADERTREEIVERLRLASPRRFVSSFDRPNIRYHVQAKTDARQQLTAFLNGRERECGIVYCLSRAKVDSTAAWLKAAGFDAMPYHAGLSATERAANQARFLDQDGTIIVATIAFGMGIDKPDVRFVAHLDLPKSIEAYYQETGRAGRDGAPADAWMVYGLQDVVRLRQMVDDSDAAEAHKRIERAKLDALLGWCELTTCRRRALLAYFGDDSVEHCGNCDTCLTPPATWDATIAAQQLLSCVYRTGQRFGAGHVIDVLTGKETPKVAQHGHAAVSTFGIGSDRPVNQWRSILRQLMVRGYLTQDHARFGALALTPQSRTLLRGELALFLREDPVRKGGAGRRARASARSGSELEAGDARLFEALREQRSALAKEQGLPPYAVFHDATLLAMVEQRPRDRDALRNLHGIGEVKLERYGDAFLAIIAATDAPTRHANTVDS